MKAGALTPATPYLFEGVVALLGGRSMKAGALTPATQAGYEGGEGGLDRSMKAGALTPATPVWLVWGLNWVRTAQ